MDNANEIKVEPRHLVLRTRMPDGSYWDINGGDLMRRVSVTIYDQKRNDGIIPMVAENGIEEFRKIDLELMDQFVKDPEITLLRWSNSLEWSQVKDIAKKHNSIEPDYTLGWRFGEKETFKK